MGTLTDILSPREAAQGISLNCGDHLTISTNTESLCPMPETNIMLHVSYNLKFKKTSKEVSDGCTQKASCLSDMPFTATVSIRLHTAQEDFFTPTSSESLPNTNTTEEP